ncbi:hypothetical protein JRI60_09945 [Archangium violaceum]|uniref:DUF5819 family protein n=1 Tax=Archangium violaceum TaxID=83451 RepID=UPI00194F610E|nr:DUF5819 family protein [Archangium violaceum]QRN99311.1 hypothetical protein JRI60_09945 [Archangium violaceum]
MASTSEGMGRSLVRVLPGLLAAVLFFHFGMTALYLTPLNPIKVALLPKLEGYMQPFFEQRWELFAPNPVVDTRLLLVACRVTDEAGQVTEQPWTNVSAPLRTLKERYRLTAADRIDRAQMTAMHLLFAKPDALSEKLQANPEETPEYKKAIELIEKQRKSKQELGREMMARMASVECDRLHGEGRTKEVRVRQVTVKSPPFSQRWSPADSGTSSYIDFEWLPYQRVATY